MNEMNETKFLDKKKFLDLEKDLLKAINEFGIKNVAASKREKDAYKLEGYIELILCLLAVRRERFRFFSGGSNYGDVAEKEYLLRNKLSELIRGLIYERMQEARTPLGLLKNMKGELCAVIKSAERNILLAHGELKDLTDVLRNI